MLHFLLLTVQLGFLKLILFAIGFLQWQIFSVFGFMVGSIEVDFASSKR